MALDEDGLWANFVRGSQRHGRVHAELARRIRCRRHHAALVRTASHHHRLAFERGIKQLLDRDEEGIHVEMEKRSHGLRAIATRGRPARSLAISTSCQSASIARTASTTA